ncbi:MAG TPA: porin [Kofleriaceae bacterium]|jgi:hypothetical protein
MHPRLWGAVVLVVLLTPAVGSAQPAPASGSDATPTQNEPTTPPPTPPPPTTSPSPTVAEIIHKLTYEGFGYLRMEYIAVQADPNVQFVGRDDGFELQNARLGVHGRYGDRIAATMAFDGAVDERAQVNSPQGTLGFNLRDAYADVTLAGQAVLRAGYFLPWVDPEALVADTTLEFVDYPIESRGVRATEGWQTPGLPPGRSLGVALHLDPASMLGTPVAVDAPRFGFEVAVQNGADEYSYNNDNNEPALSVSALLRWPNDSWIVVAGRYNPRTIGTLPFRQDETDYQGTAGLHVALGPVSLGGGVVLEHTTFDTTGGPAQDAYGGHAQILVRVPFALPLQVGYRFGVLDPSSLVTTDRVIEHTVGAVLSVPSYRVRVLVQGVIPVEQAARELANDRFQIAGELTL